MSRLTAIDCERALKFILEFIDRELPPKEHAAVEQHLHTCRSCFSRMEFEKRLKLRLAELADGEPPLSMKSRIRALIKRF
jgi:anti-sigma factor (TIGR02949 family)